MREADLSGTVYALAIEGGDVRPFRATWVSSALSLRRPLSVTEQLLLDPILIANAKYQALRF